MALPNKKTLRRSSFYSSPFLLLQPYPSPRGLTPAAELRRVPRGFSALQVNLAASAFLGQIVPTVLRSSLSFLSVSLPLVTSAAFFWIMF